MTMPVQQDAAGLSMEQAAIDTTRLEFAREELFNGKGVGSQGEEVFCMCSSATSVRAWSGLGSATVSRPSRLSRFRGSKGPPFNTKTMKHLSSRSLRQLKLMPFQSETIEGGYVSQPRPRKGGLGCYLRNGVTGAAAHG